MAATAKTESTGVLSSSDYTTTTRAGVGAGAAAAVAVAVADISSTESPTDDCTSTTTSNGEGVVSIDEPDDDDDDSKNNNAYYDWKDMNVVVSDLCHSYPVESMVYANGESPTLLGDHGVDYDYNMYDCDDDGATAISGITFQSTATDEMERFHRELEMEMFGYEQSHINNNVPPTTALQPPPPQPPLQPIGRTLAVPSKSSSKPSNIEGPVLHTTFDDVLDACHNTPSEVSHDLMGIRSNNAPTIAHHHNGAAVCNDEFLFYDDHQQPHQDQRYISSPEYYHLCQLQQRQQQQLAAAHASRSSSIPNVAAVYNQATSGLFRGYSLHNAYSTGGGGGGGSTRSGGISGNLAAQQQQLHPELQPPPPQQQTSLFCHCNTVPTPASHFWCYDANE